MRKLLPLLVIALLLIVAVPAYAITYGEPDGNRHPNVGALVGTFGDQTYPYCSGTLISPTVFLTAAHCDIGTTRVSVTFAPAYVSGATLYAGTFYGNPQYTQRQNDPHDIAVVVLDAPVVGITPARLPNASLLEGVGKNQQFTAVGYGAQETTSAPGGHVLTYLDVREYAVSTFNALGPGYMRLSQNPATGNGGTCYGDSGGPNFLGAGAGETNIVASTTITGDRFCKATSVTYRLDTVSARSFLGQFVALP